MSNYFYTDENDQKQGPVDGQALKELVAQGVIEPKTPLETESGHKGVAGQIPGLFPTAPSPFTQTTQPAQAAPVPAPRQLYCTNCGNSVSEQAVACMSCGAKPVGHRKFCRQCGVGLTPEQVICVKCGAGVTSGFGVGIESVMGALSSCTKRSQIANIYFTVGILAGLLFFVIGLVRVFSMDPTIMEGLMAFGGRSDTSIYLQRMITDPFLIIGFILVIVAYTLYRLFPK